MKGVPIFLLLLAGCAAQPDMHALEDAALESGDWSAVERREQSLQRRRLDGPSCPSGYVGYCYVKLGEDRCDCIPTRGLRSRMTR